MTFNELINKINQFIIANNNREITADILNPILKDIANYFSTQVGNLDNSSVNGSDVVAKINTLNTLIGQVNGLVILTGGSNPNDTPPANYTVGNMYLQSVSGLILGLYIFNGNEWAVLKNWINDNVTSDILTWSSEKIVNYINNKNELISTNGYLLTNSSITFYAGARWRISNVIYTNINDITIPVPIANPGMYRTDLYVGNSNGQIVRVAGVESSTLEAAPNLPANTVAITESTTYGDHTNLQPAPNLDGLKPKIESGIIYFNDSGVLNNLNLVGQEGHLYLNAATELKSVNITNGFQPYDGKQLILTNNNTVNITITNNAIGSDIFTPFVFTTGIDYILKPKESVVFYYSLHYGKFYFLSTNLSVTSSNKNVSFMQSLAAREAVTATNTWKTYTSDYPSVSVSFWNGSPSNDCGTGELPIIKTSAYGITLDKNYLSKLEYILWQDIGGAYSKRIIVYKADIIKTQGSPAVNHRIISEFTITNLTSTAHFTKITVNDLEDTPDGYNSIYTIYVRDLSGNGYSNRYITWNFSMK